MWFFEHGQPACFYLKASGHCRGFVVYVVSFGSRFLNPDSSQNQKSNIEMKNLTNGIAKTPKDSRQQHLTPTL